MENNNFEKQFKRSIDNATLDSNIYKPAKKILHLKITPMMKSFLL